MQRIIKNNEVVDETWHLLPKDFSIDEITNCDDYIVPLALWREHSRMLKARDGGLGVWLDADEEAEEIGDDVANFKVIALNFPAFTDGRDSPTPVCCVTVMVSQANCGRLAMCCATSCSICIVAVSMPLHCVPTKTRMKRWKASKTSR